MPLEVAWHAMLLISPRPGAQTGTPWPGQGAGANRQALL